MIKKGSITIIESDYEEYRKGTHITGRVDYNSCGEPIKLDFWHIMNGKWCHIVQSLEDGEVVYYTNGIKQNPPLPYSGED